MTRKEILDEINALDAAGKLGKEYTYGMMDATLTTTKDKRAFYVWDSLTDQYTKHATWHEANGKARLIVARAKSY